MTGTQGLFYFPLRYFSYHPIYSPDFTRLSGQGSVSSITQFLPILRAVWKLPLAAICRALAGFLPCRSAYSTRLISMAYNQVFGANIR